MTEGNNPDMQRAIRIWRAERGNKDGQPEKALLQAIVGTLIVEGEVEARKKAKEGVSQEAIQIWRTETGNEDGQPDQVLLKVIVSTLVAEGKAAARKKAKEGVSQK
jgi:hypothetical protein